VTGSADRSVIVGGARTPIGKLGGGLSSFTAMELGGLAVEAALERAGIAGADVDYVVLGQVLQAGQGQITARQAAVKGGIPMSVPAITINKVCLSGLNAIALADQLIRAGEFDVVVAGGMESMTSAPYLLPRARQGYRYGNAEVLDATFHDGLFDAFDRRPWGVHRAAQRRVRLHPRGAGRVRRALARAGRRRDQGGPLRGRDRRRPRPAAQGRPGARVRGRGVRPGTTVESLGRLKPAFRKDGTITAGNASQISDGPLRSW
jgi:acetyl-CoA C-acetyltransferase